MKNNRKIEVGQVRAAQFGTEHEYIYHIEKITDHPSGQYREVEVNILGSNQNYTWFETCIHQDVVVM